MGVRPIDANALVASLQKSYKEMRELVDSMKEDDSAKEVFQGELVTFLETILRTKSMPTLDYEPVRHGEWVGLEFDGYADGCPVYDLWECSECKGEHKGEYDTLTDYCPNCGAKMRKGEA